jgi:hypothetical protein
VKLLRVNKNSFVFQFNAREQELLFEVLQLYPLVPATRARLTKDPAAQSAENQRLLEESLAEQRAENRRHVTALLNAPDRLQPSGKHVLLKLQPTEMEWLLQVLNDLRVGSWIALGEPDEDRPPEITPENFRHAVTMEVCGAFESLLLAAFGETESPDWLG